MWLYLQRRKFKDFPADTSVHAAFEKNMIAPCRLFQELLQLSSYDNLRLLARFVRHLFDLEGAASESPSSVALSPT